MIRTSEGCVLQTLFQMLISQESSVVLFQTISKNLLRCLSGRAKRTFDKRKIKAFFTKKSLAREIHAGGLGSANPINQFSSVQLFNLTGNYCAFQVRISFWKVKNATNSRNNDSQTISQESSVVPLWESQTYL